MVEHCVIADGVTLSYGSVPAVSQATFTLPAGKSISFIGPNGSGKSTLLHAFVGLTTPQRGTLTVLGAPAGDDPRRVAYVLQSTETNTRMPVTVREVVTMGCYARIGLFGRLSRSDRAEVDVALERLDIADLARRHLHELSGGQRQRVLVAQGLVQRAELLLLDEPVTGLDIPSRERIVKVVDEERSRGTTVVVTTHDLAEAADADHVLLLAGRVVASGPPEEVLTPELLAEAYGGTIIPIGDRVAVFDDPHHHHTRHTR